MDKLECDGQGYSLVFDWLGSPFLMTSKEEVCIRIIHWQTTVGSCLER